MLILAHKTVNLPASSCMFRRCIQSIRHDRKVTHTVKYLPLLSCGAELPSCLKCVILFLSASYLWLAYGLALTANTRLPGSLRHGGGWRDGDDCRRSSVITASVGQGCIWLSFAIFKFIWSFKDKYWFSHKLRYFSYLYRYFKIH